MERGGDGGVKSHLVLRSSTIWRGSFPFLALEDFRNHWFNIFTKAPYRLRTPLQKQWAHFCLAMFTTFQTPHPWPGACNGGMLLIYLNKPVLLQYYSWNSESRPALGNGQFRGQLPSSAKLFPRNCDLLWVSALWKRASRWSQSGPEYLVSEGAFS